MKTKLYKLTRTLVYLFTLSMAGGLMGNVAQAATTMRTLLHEARRGDTVSMRKVARILWEGTSSAGVDKRNAVAWWIKAANAGDTKAMVILGDLYAHGTYFAQNQTKARNYYEKAESMGSQTAKKRLLDLQHTDSDIRPSSIEPKDEEVEACDNVSVDNTNAQDSTASVSASSPTVRKLPPAQKLQDALATFSKRIIQAAADNSVQEIAIARFQSNGGSGGSLSDNVQSLLIEEMLDKSADIAVADRTNERYIEVENSLGDTASELSSANAVLVGEVFSSPGDPIGICSVRLFRVSDCRILFAGCTHVRWTDEETMLMGASSRSTHTHSFAYMDEDSIQKLEAQAASIPSGFAFIQDGSQSSSNTLDLRIACAQVLSTLVNKGARAYEREFFIIAAREQARNDSSVFDSNCKAEAIALIKPNPAVAGNFPVTLQIQSTATRRLLKNIRLNMLAGGAAGEATGNSGQNDLTSRISQMKETLMAASPIAEVECNVPQEAMEAYFEECYRRFGGDEQKIKRSLAVAAIVGFVSCPNCMEPKAPAEVKKTRYNGPLPQAADELNARYEISESGRSPTCYNVYRMYNCSDSGLLKGQWKHSIDDDIVTRYEISIEWSNGLPCKVRVKLDLSSSKNKLLRRSSPKE